MGQSHLYTFIISMVFLIQLIIDAIIERKIFIKEINKIHLTIAIIIILVGFLAIILGDGLSGN